MATTHTESFRLNCGDTLTIEWNGNVDVAPSCGAQFARASDALRVELAAYLRSSGENVDDADELVLDDHGEWIDEN